jgi:uridine kinase
MDQTLGIAIVGPSGGGKTTLATNLATSLRGLATVVSQDDFLLAQSDRGGSGLLNKYAFDEFHSAIERLRAGQPFAFVPFDQRERRRTGWREIQPAPVIVVEGVVALHCALVREMATLRMYVDAPPSLRAMRQLQRARRGDHYRGLSRQVLRQNITDKEAEEQASIAYQRQFCHWTIDTSTLSAKHIAMETTNELETTLAYRS